MNLLVIKNKYFDDHILLCFKDFFDSLSCYDASKHNCKIYSVYSDQIQEILFNFHNIDWILVSGIDKNVDLIRKKTKSRVIVFWDDIHYHTQEAFKNRMKMFENSDILLLPYYKQFLKRKEYIRFWHKAVYFPWYAPKACFDNNIDFELRKNKILMSGRVSDSYEIRKQIVKFYKSDTDFEFLDHPGYNREKRSHQIMREKYYEYLSNYKIAIATTADSPLNYTVAKYFEIPACGCALILQKTLDIDDLGFVENEHYVPVNKNNLRNLKELIKDFDLRKMAKKSFELIKNRHLVANRIELLFEKIG